MQKILYDYIINTHYHCTIAIFSLINVAQTWLFNGIILIYTSMQRKFIYLSIFNVILTVQSVMTEKCYFLSRHVPHTHRHKHTYCNKQAHLASLLLTKRKLEWTTSSIYQKDGRNSVFWGDFSPSSSHHISGHLHR